MTWTIAFSPLPWGRLRWFRHQMHPSGQEGGCASAESPKLPAQMSLCHLLSCLLPYDSQYYGHSSVSSANKTKASSLFLSLDFYQRLSGKVIISLPDFHAYSGIKLQEERLQLKKEWSDNDGSRDKEIFQRPKPDITNFHGTIKVCGFGVFFLNFIVIVEWTLPRGYFV